MSVGGGFHGGSPEGVQRRLREGARAGGTFLLCSGTLGLCSRLALSEDGTRTVGGGQTWVRVPVSLRGLEPRGGAA